MFTLVGFSESIDPAGAFNALTALVDPHVTVNGDDVQIPVLNKIIAVAGLIENTAEAQLRLTCPSLRMKSRFMVEPLNMAGAAAVEPGSPHRVLDLRRNPIELVTGERLNAETDSNPAAAQIQSAFVWLADGPVEPINGAIFTVHATATTTLVAQSWTGCPLTFDEDLPRGRYQIVGLRVRSAGCLAARVFLQGNPWRPGVLGVDAQDDIEHPMFRYGQLGVFGEFEDTDTVTVEVCSASADTAEDFYLDLIQVRNGPA